jgi:hypothetical protein
MSEVVDIPLPEVIEDKMPYDVCDATASGTEQASYRVVMEGKTLDLCPHHWRKHEEALTAAGWVVARTLVRNSKPSPSANAE